MVMAESCISSSIFIIINKLVLYAHAHKVNILVRKLQQTDVLLSFSLHVYRVQDRYKAVVILPEKIPLLS